MRELDRQADIRRNQDAAEAVGRGAFGGSRQAVLESERDRGLQQVKSDTLSKLLSQGFGQALKALTRGWKTIWWSWTSFWYFSWYNK